METEIIENDLDSYYVKEDTYDEAAAYKAKKLPLTEHEGSKLAMDDPNYTMSMEQFDSIMGRPNGEESEIRKRLKPSN